MSIKNYLNVNEAAIYRVTKFKIFIDIFWRFLANQAKFFH